MAFYLIDNDNVEYISERIIIDNLTNMKTHRRVDSASKSMNKLSEAYPKSGQKISLLPTSIRSYDVFTVDDVVTKMVDIATSLNDGDFQLSIEYNLLSFDKYYLLGIFLLSDDEIKDLLKIQNETIRLRTLLMKLSERSSGGTGNE